MRKKFIIGLLVLLGGLYLLLWLILTQPDFRKSAANPSEVSTAVLERHVKTLSVDFAPRSGKHLINTKRTADYIHQEFAKVGSGEVSDQWFELGSSRYRNVSLLLGDAKADRIVIGAHYDGYDTTPGADDNASGVAGVIELAKLFANDPISTPIEFVGFPLEEPPYFRTEHMGSRHHADAMTTKCKYMISVEMIGYFSDERGSQAYPVPLLNLVYPSKGNFIAVVGNMSERKLLRDFKVGMKGSTELPVYSISGPEALPGIDFSDHRNYWAAGYPAVMVTDTSFYRNLEYHTANDTYDRLDYNRMAMVIRGIESAVRRLESN